jgi:hypothetical protein
MGNINDGKVSLRIDTNSNSNLKRNYPSIIDGDTKFFGASGVFNIS